MVCWATRPRCTEITTLRDYADFLTRNNQAEGFAACDPATACTVTTPAMDAALRAHQSALDDGATTRFPTFAMDDKRDRS